MSGGHFDYKNFHISNIADEIEKLVNMNESKEMNEWGEPVGRHFTSETIAEFKKAIVVLREASIYSNRIDYLVSSDDSENDFHERLKEDLAELDKKSGIA